MGYLLFILFFCLYGICVPHSVGWKDAGEFTLFAQTMGVAHPAGYPLFLLIGKVFSLLPLGTIAFRLNLLSVFWGAVAVVLVYALILLLLQKGELGRSMSGFRFGSANQSEGLKVLVAFGVAIVFGLSRSFWRFATVCEAYTLHMAALAGLLCIFYAITLRPENNVRRWCLLFFILGLGLGNHVTLILYSPIFLVPFIIGLFREKQGKVQLLIGSVVFFCVGLSCYLYLPIRAHADPLMNWGNPDTPGRLFAHLTGKQYALKTFSLPLELFPLRLARLGKELPAEIPVILMLAAVPGLVGLFRRGRKVWLPLVALICINGLFFLRYGEWVSHLFLPTYLALYCLIAVGMYECLARLIYGNRKISDEREQPGALDRSPPTAATSMAVPGLVLLFAILVFSLLAQFWKNRELFYRLPDAVPMHVAQEVLCAVPSNALLILEDGNTVNAVLYAQYTERMRADVIVLDPYGTFYSQAMAKGFHALDNIWWGNLPGQAQWWNFRVALMTFLQNTDQYDNILMDSTFVVASQISPAHLQPHGFLLEYVQTPHAMPAVREVWKRYISEAWQSHRQLIMSQPWVLEDAVTREALVAQMNNAALVVKEAGLNQEARAIWEWLLGIDDRSKEVLLNLAAYADETDDAGKAKEYFQKAGTLYPDDAFVHLQTGIYHLRHGRDEDALREFRFTLKLDRQDQQARYNEAVLLLRAGKVEQAKKQLRLLLRVNPEHTKAKSLLEQIEK